jgi:hypothetical protein
VETNPLEGLVPIRQLAVVHQTIRIADCWLLIGLNQQSPIDNQQFHFARGSAFRAGSVAS